TTGTVGDEGTFTASAAALSASWTGFSDAVSGVAQYSYSIGTSAGDTSVRTWTNAALATTVNAPGLALTDGQAYVINVRAVDNAGNLTAPVSTDGITVDTTAPTAGMVLDDGTYTTNATALSV